MKTVVSSKGQIVLPAELRRQDRIVPGEQFDVERVDAGQYLLKKRTASGLAGVLDWLRACPDGDWFRPLTSDSTDSL
jgi:AbrB family looped-hinge helix DNA binding protein